MLRYYMQPVNYINFSIRLYNMVIPDHEHVSIAVLPEVKAAKV